MARLLRLRIGDALQIGAVSVVVREVRKNSGRVTLMVDAPAELHTPITHPPPAPALVSDAGQAAHLFVLADHVSSLPLSVQAVVCPPMDILLHRPADCADAGGVDAFEHDEIPF